MHKLNKFTIIFSPILVLVFICLNTAWLGDTLHLFALNWGFEPFHGLSTAKIAILQIFSLKSVMFFVAHAPHDDVFGVGLSPDFERDRTIYSIVRGTFLKSNNGGNTWKRIVKGLDNKFELYSLKCAAKDKNVLFITSQGDGIYKSQDRGDSWFKVNKGLETLSIDLVSISAKSPDIVFAVGTQCGFYQTKNSGQSWSKILEQNIRITAISSFFEEEQAKDCVVAGDSQGILYFSRTGGDSWEKHLELVNNDEILDIKFSPNYSRDNTFFVGTKSKGLFRTVDGGVSFSRIDRGLSDNSITSIATITNQKNQPIIYISTWQQGVFYSEDNGNTWQPSSKGLSKDKQADDFGYERPHFSNLRVANTVGQKKIIFLAGFDGLFKSIDSGKVWQKLDTLSANIIVSLGISPNYHRDSTVAISTYLGGGYITHDRGINWSAINQGLLELKKYVKQGHLVRLFEVIFSPDYDSDNTLFSSSWRRFYTSRNQGKNWNIQYFGPKKLLKKFKLGKSPKSLIEPPLIISASPNYTIDKALYVGTKFGDILQVINGVIIDKLVGRIGQRIYSLAISADFTDDRTLYAGAQDGVYKSLDSGATWKCVSKTATVTNLAISPEYKVDGTVFAGTAEGIFKTEDRGNNWFKLTDTPFGEDYYVEAVVTSPSYAIERTLLVSIRGKGLFKSINDGKTFVEVGKSLLENNHLLSNFGSGYNCTSVPIKFSPNYAQDQTIYGFSGLEVFKSGDGGITWESIFRPSFSNKNTIRSLYRLASAPWQTGGIITKRD